MIDVLKRAALFDIVCAGSGVLYLCYSERVWSPIPRADRVNLPIIPWINDDCLAKSYVRLNKTFGCGGGRAAGAECDFNRYWLRELGSQLAKMIYVNEISTTANLQLSFSYSIQWFGTEQGIINMKALVSIRPTNHTFNRNFPILLQMFK